METVDSSPPLVALIVGTFFVVYTAVMACTFLLHYFDAANRADVQPFSPSFYLRVFVREWWWTLGVVLFYPLGLVGGSKAPPMSPEGGPPVLLLPGYAMNRACLFALYWRLRRRGYNNVVTRNLTPMLAPISVIAQPVAAEVRRLAKQAGQPVTVIAHSMGGLVMRQALAEDPELPVAKLITVGTPHRGTRWAVFGAGPNARQMHCDCEFVNCLPPKAPVPSFSLYSLLDNIVIPSESAKWGDHQLEMSQWGHMGLLFAAEPFEWIAAELPAPQVQPAAEGRPSLTVVR